MLKQNTTLKTQNNGQIQWKKWKELNIQNKKMTAGDTWDILKSFEYLVLKQKATVLVTLKVWG